jgi:hypothetical protein
MTNLTDHEIKHLTGGGLVAECSDIPPPPPPKIAFLPPNPDNPTANAPTTLSPD